MDEFPNLWTVFIGPPRMLKSPAMQAALVPVRHLEAEAAQEYEVARAAYKVKIDAFKLRKQVGASLEKKGAEKKFRAQC